MVPRLEQCSWVEESHCLSKIQFFNNKHQALQISPQNTNDVFVTIEEQNNDEFLNTEYGELIRRKKLCAYTEIPIQG